MLLFIDLFSGIKLCLNREGQIRPKHQLLLLSLLSSFLGVSGRVFFFSFFFSLLFLIFFNFIIISSPPPPRPPFFQSFSFLFPLSFCAVPIFVQSPFVYNALSLLICGIQSIKHLAAAAVEVVEAVNSSLRGLVILRWKFGSSKMQRERLEQSVTASLKRMSL